jgi:hypothetical protein
MQMEFKQFVPVKICVMFFHLKDAGMPYPELYLVFL